MLTRKQHELLTFINARLGEGGISPSFEEMKEALALKSKSGVHRLISALEERKFIRRLPNRARALEVLRLPDAGLTAPAPRVSNVIAPSFGKRKELPIAANDVVDIPLHGRIAAGQPIEAFENHETLTVPSMLLGTGDHYALEVSGDSMVEAGIFDGDYALVRRCETANDGDIVVALVDENEATLKYLRRDRGNIRLVPANASYQPQIYPSGRVRVQGKLVGLLRRYH